MQLATTVESCKPGLHRQAPGDNLWQQTQAVFWILLSLLVAFYGNGKHDLITVARRHPDVWREAYYVGIAGVGINISVFLYLAFWKTSVTALDSAHPFEPGSSAAIHFGTAAGIIAILALVSAFWPVWNILTPIIMFIIFMGLLMSIQLFPWWSLPFTSHQQSSVKAD